MRFTTRPATAVIVSVVLVLAGLYLALWGEGSTAMVGWLMVACGALGAVANLALARHLRDE